MDSTRIKTHLKEVIVRLRYCIFSWLLCFLCVYVKNTQCIYIMVKPTYISQPPTSAWSRQGVNKVGYGTFKENASGKSMQEGQNCESQATPMYPAPRGDDSQFWNTDNVFPQNTYDFIYTNVTEAFYVTLQSCVWFSFLFTFPFLLYQFWCFLIPSRYCSERIAFNRLIIMCTIYMVACLWVILFWLVPQIGQFLHMFAVTTGRLQITNQARIACYLSWLFNTVVTLFVASLLPLLMYFSLKANWITLDFLIKNRKLYLYVLLILAALVSPPDLSTQFIVSFFLFVFLECVIWVYLYHMQPS